jgi:GAF domain
VIVSAPGVAAGAKTTPVRRRRLALPSALRYKRASGLMFVALLMIVVEVLGQPAALDPAVLLPVAVLAGVALGGLSSGILAAIVGGAWLVLFYAQPGLAASGAGMARAVGSMFACGASILIAAYLIDRARLDGAAAAARRPDVVGELAARLASVRTEHLTVALVGGAAELLRADMAVLTVLEPASGRHVVRAARGSGSSPIGVEVVPGVGITGQAIRDRRVVVAAAFDTSSAQGLTRRLGGKSGASMAAVAGVQADRVVASLTVGRSDGSSFSAEDQRLLGAIGSLAALAVVGSLVHRAGSP